MQSEVAGHASNHPEPNTMLAPRPPYQIICKTSVKKQQATQHMTPEGIRKHSRMLQLLCALWPVELFHVVGCDVSFAAALRVGPRYSPVF